MKRLPSLTIGIPAHNEEANIRELLRSVLTQHNKTFLLTKILVSSDGSTDRTNQYVQQFAKKDSRIVLISNQHRRGIARGMNQLLSNTNTDIFVLLNADVILKDKDSIAKLVAPILQTQIDLTAGALIEAPTSSFFEQSLQVSMQLKNKLFESIGNGNNIYTCHGPARAFSKKLYRQLHFPAIVGDDMYSYLFCLKHGFKFQYVKASTVVYQLPRTMQDYLKQSTRYYSSKLAHNAKFGEQFVQTQLHIPVSAYAKAALLSLPILLRYPVHVAYYIALQLGIRLEGPVDKLNDHWDIALSSKSVSIKI